MVISFEFAGERLDSYISSMYADISRNRIQEAIECGFILVNRHHVKKSYILKENDDLEILQEISCEVMVTPQDIKIDILYEDDYYIIINKHENIVVHPGHGHRDGTLLNALYYYSGGQYSPILVNRLDKNTSGAIIAAKSDRAHERLSKKFHDREIYKGYVGLCIGKFPNNISGVIDLPIWRSKKDPTRQSVDYENGREARTDYRIVEYVNGIYFACFRLHSGRTHQIRLHCSHNGFPILRDNLYGGEKDRLKFLEQNDRPTAQKIFNCFNRQALHSRFISFQHPYTEETISITAPFEKDFLDAFATAGINEEKFNIFGGEIL